MTDKATIFVSYARPDEEFAQALLTALRPKLPLTVEFMIDAGTVSPGENVFVGMANRLSGADAFMIIMSAASERSAWVQAQVAWALARRGGNLPIFPILIGPRDAVPDLLRSIVYVDFHQRPFEVAIDELARAIVRRLASPSQPSKSSPATAEELATEYLANKKEILDSSEMREARHQSREHVRIRLAVALGFLASGCSLMIAIYALIWGATDHVAANLASALVAPLIGLFGTVIGFYFGRTSKESEIADRSSDDRRKEKGSSWSR